MKKIFTIFVAMVLLAALTATSQIIRGGKDKNQSQKPKTEQTQKQNSPSKSKQSKSSKQSKPQHLHQNTAVPKVQEPTAYDVTFTSNVKTASMFIDGNNYGTPDGSRILKTGKHDVKLTAKGYNDFTTTIYVEKGNTSFNFEMTKKPAHELEPTQSTQSISQPISHSISAVVQKAIDDMVYVEGGTFTMGATSEQKTDSWDRNEKPIHHVTLSGFYIGKYEVTQALWQTVMGENPSCFVGELNCPVERVSWEDCQVFLTKLNQMTGKTFRLPTEAEWEFAARGGNLSKGYKYSGNNMLDEIAWYRNNSGKTTHPVGTKAPNELGLYDMSGNVNEWCQDWMGKYIYESQTNPKGPISGSRRVFRGGSWGSGSSLGDGKESCRISVRDSIDPAFSGDDIGFRLAL